jgi:hypothetical protein
MFDPGSLTPAKPDEKHSKLADLRSAGGPVRLPFATATTGASISTIPSVFSSVPFFQKVFARAEPGTRRTGFLEFLCVGWRGGFVRLGALDGEAGAGEAAGAAVVGEAPLLHQPRTGPTRARPDQRARRRMRRGIRDSRTGESLASPVATRWRAAGGTAEWWWWSGERVVRRGRGAFIAARRRGGRIPVEIWVGQAAPRDRLLPRQHRAARRGVASRRACARAVRRPLVVACG